MNRFERFGLIAARWILGGVFVYAGAVKAFDPPGFAGQVAAYKLLPYSGNLLVAATLPYVELLVGILLLIERKVRPATLILLALNLAFLVLLGWAWGTGLQIDCGCFRPGESTSPRSAFLRDLPLLALTLWLWCRYERGESAAP